jgi:hypothetical protein
MLIPKYVLEDLSVGSGSIIGKSNIEEFFNHISMHKEVEEKSLVELAPSIEVASAYLIHMLETRFASLNPFMQYMFLLCNTCSLRSGIKRENGRNPSQFIFFLQLLPLLHGRLPHVLLLIPVDSTKIFAPNSAR